MSAAKPRPSPAARRAGYTVAAVVNVVLLVLINGRPGWSAVPFLTGGMTAVLPLLNASLLIGVAVDLVQIVHDPRWTVALGGIVTTAVGIAVLARLWEVFPFAFTDPSTDWAMVVRVVLAVGLIGSAAGLLAHTISLLGAVRQRLRAGHA